MPRKTARASAQSTAETLLSLTEAAGKMGISPVTLRKAANRGRVKVVKTPSGETRIEWSEIERYRAEQKTQRSLSQKQRRANERRAQEQRLQAISRRNLEQRDALMKSESTILVPATELRGVRRRGTYILPEHPDPISAIIAAEEAPVVPEATMEVGMEETVVESMEVGAEGGAEGVEEDPQSKISPMEVYQKLIDLGQQQIALEEQQQALELQQVELLAQQRELLNLLGGMDAASLSLPAAEGDSGAGKGS